MSLRGRGSGVENRPPGGSGVCRAVAGLRRVDRWVLTLQRPYQHRRGVLQGFPEVVWDFSLFDFIK